MIALLCLRGPAIALLTAGVVLAGAAAQDRAAPLRAEQVQGIAPLGAVAGLVLHAGVARPEYLWLVLDRAGAPTLYRGAVLSYRECTDTKGIPDCEWRQRVAAGQAPPPPFAASFRR